MMLDQFVVGSCIRFGATLELELERLTVSEDQRDVTTKRGCSCITGELYKVV